MNQSEIDALAKKYSLAELVKITNRGVVVPSLEDVWQNVAGMLIDGLNLNMNPNLPQSQMARGFSVMAYELILILESLNNSINTRSLTGKILDDRASLFGLVRRPPTPSTLQIEIESTLTGFTLKKGMIIEALNNSDYRFELTEDIDIINSKQQTDKFISINELAEYQLKTGSFFRATDQVTYPYIRDIRVVSLNKGEAIETDYSLQARLLIASNISGVGGIEQLRKQLINIDGVTRCHIVDNNSKVDTTDVLARHWKVVIEGGVEDGEGNIWDTLAKHSNLCQYDDQVAKGAIVKDYSTVYGGITNTTHVAYYRPVEVLVGLKINFSLLGVSSLTQEFKDKLINLAEEYINNIAPNESCISSVIANILNQHTNGLGMIQNIELHSASTYYPFIVPNDKGYFKLDRTDIVWV